MRALRQVRSACEVADWAVAEQQLSEMRRTDARHPLTLLAQARFEQARGQREAACSALEAAIAGAPDLFDAWLSLGQLRAQLRQYMPALAALQQALRLRPLDLEALELMIALLQLTGDLPAVDACLRLLLDPDLVRQPAWLALPAEDRQALLERRPSWETMSILNGFSWGSLDREDIYQRLQAWQARYAGGRLPLSRHAHLLPDANRPLRIGYLAKEWNTPILAHLFFGPWQQMDRENFIAVAYSESPLEALPEPIRDSFSGLRQVGGWSEMHFYHQIQADAIDILVDLAGLFNARRLLSLTYKPAPIQINAGFNPPFRLGLDCFDAVFSDRWLIPPELAAGCAESVRYLDRFYAWMPPGPIPPAQPSPRAAGLKLGCAPSLNKVSDRSLRLWVRVMEALPEARLTLKNQVFRDHGVRQRLAARFAACGGDSSRLDFEDNLARQDLISFFRECDLILETFPYSGGLSLCDAFWAGVPMPGITGHLNLAEAMRLGLNTPELMADSETAYIQMVVDLCRNPELRARMREELPRRMLASPSCDHRNHMRQMEAHYRTMWGEWLGRQGLRARDAGRAGEKTGE